MLEKKDYDKNWRSDSRSLADTVQEGMKENEKDCTDALSQFELKAAIGRMSDYFPIPGGTKQGFGAKLSSKQVGSIVFMSLYMRDSNWKPDLANLFDGLTFTAVKYPEDYLDANGRSINNCSDSEGLKPVYDHYLLADRANLPTEDSQLSGGVELAYSRIEMTEEKVSEKLEKVIVVTDIWVVNKENFMTSWRWPHNP